MMVQQLKNRYNDPNKNKRFLVGIDRSKMRLYEVDEQDLVQDTPVYDSAMHGTDVVDNHDKFQDFKF
jgi:hypothetical protein